MVKDKTVQFVCFETKLGHEQFIAQWELYTRSVNSDVDVTLQQSEKNGLFKYIAQHRCPDGEFKFVFTKASRTSRTPEVEVKIKQAGGYSILQLERKNEVHSGESKVFAFISNPQADLTIYRQLSPQSKLNIYEAYYENCQYAYILEYFVHNKATLDLVAELKKNEAVDIGVYNECMPAAV